MSSLDSNTPDGRTSAADEESARNTTGGRSEASASETALGSIVPSIIVGIILLALIVLPIGIVALVVAGIQDSIPPIAFATFAMLPAFLLGAASVLVMLGSK